MQFLHSRALVFLARVCYRSMKYRSLEENRMFELEGTYKDHLVKLLEQFRADQKLSNVAKVFFPNAS